MNTDKVIEKVIATTVGLAGVATKKCVDMVIKIITDIPKKK